MQISTTPLREKTMQKLEFLFFFLVALVCSSVQQTFKPNFNSKTGGVFEITLENFKTLVLNSDDKWLVDFEFSGPNCPYCIKMSELINKAVPLLKEKKIKVGYVDYFSAGGKRLIDAFGIKGFPAIYIFGEVKESPIQYYPYAINTPEEFVKSVEFYLRKPQPAEGICGQDSVENPNKSNTYELTDANFDEVVLKCEDPWIINFYFPDVKICADFITYFEAAAKEFKGRAKFGALLLVGSKVAEKYGANKVCMMKLFPAGMKDGVQPVDYNHGAHSPEINSNLIPWIKTALSSGLPDPEVTELTSQSVLESKCKKSGVTSCIFVFLAKSDRCNATCKQTYLDLLKQMVSDRKGEHWAWLWTTQGKQPDFERTFALQSFPGVFAVDIMAKTFSVSRGTATESRIKEFIQLYSSGRLPSKNLPATGFPTVRSS